eukprot:TRINITY_DN3026_c0_g1_i2.p1 TRINITY_DN3026_c0_g1~~TRINITY_DN3026_c0_g1_i2.p1  ORF type:complete len:643 (+),score=74.28 TRINITY_DN3026_c0_g1_i2:77-2005(+)
MLGGLSFVLCLYSTIAIRRDMQEDEFDFDDIFGRRRRFARASKSLALKVTTGSTCEAKAGLFLDALAQHWYYYENKSVGKQLFTYFSSSVFDKEFRTKPPPEGIADDFTVAFYSIALNYNLRRYSTRHAKNVRIPKSVGNGKTKKFAKIEAPLWDCDNRRPKEKSSFRIMPSFDCILEALRKMPFKDALDDNVRHPNNWKSILSESGGKFKTKREWVDSFYKYYTMKSGEPVYPQQEVDFRQYFRRENIWDDNLEKTMAFGLIGAHRVEENRNSAERETLPWCLLLNFAADFPVRHGFGKYGGDMYFSRDGLPARIITPSNQSVVPGDKDWEYWKFVWRSTMLALVTLIDHLHFSHLRVGNIFARASREALPAKHPLRRLFSIFTFGTIQVNTNAVSTLVGPNHVLHRATAFKDYESVGNSVPSLLKPITEEHKHFFNETEWNALPAILSTSPYFQDGRHLFSALATFVRRYLKHVANLCDANDEVIDRKALDFLGVLAILEKDASYAHEKCRTCTCITNLFIGAAWTVTGFHRQVGQVAGYADPDLASFSWKSGELFGRPRQYLMQSMIAATTAKAQPKLTEDYSHVFKGMDGDATLAKQIWHEFQEQLAEVRETVRKNNMDREVKNFQADPDLVECSIAV